MLRPLAVGSTIRLETNVAENLPPVLADSARIQQVLSNLVGNAVKFTPREGRITVCAERIGSEVRFSVIDTGPGIPAEQLPHIFGRFWQARSPTGAESASDWRSRRASSRPTMGRIWVESNVGLGSTFYFTLPIAGASDLPALRVGSGRRSASRLDPPNIGLNAIPLPGFLFSVHIRRPASSQ